MYFLLKVIINIGYFILVIKCHIVSGEPFMVSKYHICGNKNKNNLDLKCKKTINQIIECSECQRKNNLMVEELHCK